MGKSKSKGIRNTI